MKPFPGRRFFFLFLTLTFILSCKSSQPDLHKPNIIFIMADDMGYGDAGCYGQQNISTPHIDKLAEGGMRFTRHYAGNTVCAPSRCALMTGYHMGHAEIRGNSQVEPSGQRPISDETVTVAEILRKAGYKTGMIGKWGLGSDFNSGDPMKQGFDFYYGYLDQVLAHNYYPEYLLRNGQREYLDNEVKYLDSGLWHRGLGSYSTKWTIYSHDLIALEGPPVKIINVLEPVSVLKSGDNWLVDMGQNMVGCIRIKASGSTGDKITLRHAEVLDREGSMYYENLSRSGREWCHW